jgi:hypothetical protein
VEEGHSLQLAVGLSIEECEHLLELLSVVGVAGFV